MQAVAGILLGASSEAPAGGAEARPVARKLTNPFAKMQSLPFLPPTPPPTSGVPASSDDDVNDLLAVSLLLIIEVPDKSMSSKLRFKSTAPVQSAKQMIERRIDNGDYHSLCSALFNPQTGEWLKDERSLRSYLLKNGVRVPPPPLPQHTHTSLTGHLVTLINNLGSIGVATESTECGMEGVEGVHRLNWGDRVGALLA